MKRFKTFLLAGAAVAVAGLVAPQAQADQILTGWDLNLANSNSLAGNPYSGATNITNVYQLDFTSGASVVNQSIIGGGASGTFSEYGYVNVGQYDTPTTTGNFILPGALGGNLGTATYLDFGYNLTGYVSGGNLVFTGGTATLYLTNSNATTLTNPVVPGSAFAIATFDVVPGTGGINIIGAGGIPSGTVQLDFTMDPGNAISDLFDLSNKDLDNIALELTAVEPTLEQGAGSPSPNPGPAACSASNTDTSTCENIYLKDSGALQLAIPEPASMAILGSGLFGLAALKRRRNKKQKQA